MLGVSPSSEGAWAEERGSIARADLLRARTVAIAPAQRRHTHGRSCWMAPYPRAVSSQGRSALGDAETRAVDQLALVVLGAIHPRDRCAR
jgi:hypothetical protein